MRPGEPLTRRAAMVMEPISIDSAIEKAKKKGLRAGRVKGTDGIQFTKGRNDRIEVIDWDEFRRTLAERELEVFESGGWMKIMRKTR
jgi:hypothetical protein